MTISARTKGSQDVCGMGRQSSTQGRKGAPLPPVYVSINGHTIRKNAVTGSAEPPIRIARSKNDTRPTYASEIEIVGPARLVYDPRKAIMRCGARLVIECADVKVVR